jgi:hypothetical protein
VRIEHRDSDEVLMAQVLVLLTRVSANETAEAVAIAHQVFDQYGPRGTEALSRVVGAHLAIRKSESGDSRGQRRIARETQRAMERDPALELEYLQRMLADIRRDDRYGASREMIDAAARLEEFSDAGSSKG